MDDERDMIFDIGWLVKNNTEPTKFQEENPPDYRKAPRHMPRVQVKYTEKGQKEYIQYFSDLKFEQGNHLLPVSMLLISLICFKHSEVQANN
jgi:hypothetical protein